MKESRKGEYKSPTKFKLRKKLALKSTQEKDWEGVGLPVRKGKGRPFNIVKKGNIIDKDIIVKGGKGFKVRKKK